jgi:dipeptidase
MFFHRLLTFLLLGLLALTIQSANACTSLVVTPGASQDGSAMVTYTCDFEFHPPLEFTPAADHKPTDSVEIRDWSDRVRGKIPQVPHTYAVLGMMNEHQLAIGETTFDGREELTHPRGLLYYWDLIFLALQRARTAREAVGVIGDLVRKHGYSATGETFSIADPKETWIMELIGPDSLGTGAEWVALRVPDGYITCYANKSRIGEFPLKDPKKCLYSENVISFAVQKGYYDPKSGKPFRFCEAYNPEVPLSRRACDGRIWSLFRRAAPSQNFSPDFFRGKEGAQPYPLWIKPDKKLSVPDVFALMRDHFEGTAFDMTKGMDAGPYGLPYRWRPLTWTVDSMEYAWERAISTQQTAYSFVSQSRSWLPDPIGGVYWYGLDDTYSTCYIPFYCGNQEVPKTLSAGGQDKFTWDSGWWVFNFVSNFAYLRYRDMIQDIQATQGELEGHFLRLQPTVEKTALALHQTDPKLMTRYLSDYSVAQAEMVVRRWRELGERLVTKYNDGYIQDEQREPQMKGYPESWLREVLRSRPKQFDLQKKKPQEAKPGGELSK